MPFSAQVLKVMIASPSDVIEERKAVREILHTWNDVNSVFRSIVLLPLGWETNTTPSMGAHPQEIINEQLLEQADILIGIFWTRLGTSTTTYKSGTVEEIKRHTDAGKIAKLYFSVSPVHPDSVDPEQYKALTEFKSECQKSGLLETFTDLTDFRAKFERQLQIELNRDIYTQQLELAVSQSLVQETPLHLSKQATDLLCDAARDRNGHIMHLRHLGGEAIQSNNKNFIPDNSPRSVALWKSALEELKEYRLIKDLGYKGEVYEVTLEGYKWTEQFFASQPLDVELAVTGEPSKQNLLVRANKKVSISQIAYMFSNEAAVAGEDIDMDGTDLIVPINQDLLLTLWNAPRPDKSSWDHSGPGKLGVTVAYGQRKRELILPVVLESVNVNNTIYRKITGKKLFSSLN